MKNNLELIKRDLQDIKLKMTFIQNWILDNEIGFEVSEEVVKEVEESRKMDGKDLIPHKEVLKKFIE